MEGRKHTAVKIRPMTDMFANDPVFKGIKRDNRGRFATAEKAQYDKAMRERSFMEYQVEKYKRIAQVNDGAFIALQRIVADQNRIIAGLRKELAKLKKSK